MNGSNCNGEEHKANNVFSIIYNNARALFLGWWSFNRRMPMLFRAW